MPTERLSLRRICQVLQLIGRRGHACRKATTGARYRGINTLVDPDAVSAIMKVGHGGVTKLASA
jgi:hypothetical protein